jgi:hypothetical protein
MAGALEGDVFIGRKAQEARGLLKIKYPMEHGIVTDWEDMERIWSWVYAEELGTLSEEVGYSTHPKFLSLICRFAAPCSPHRGTIKPSKQSRRCGSNIFRHVQRSCAIHIRTGRSFIVSMSLPTFLRVSG